MKPTAVLKHHARLHTALNAREDTASSLRRLARRKSNQSIAVLEEHAQQSAKSSDLVLRWL
jgi:hypothetical protein